MRHLFDPLSDMKNLFRSIDETQRLLEEADPLRSLREIQDQIRVYRPLFDSSKLEQLVLQPVLPTEILAQVDQLVSLGDQIKGLLPQAGSFTRLAEATALARNWLSELTAGPELNLQLFGLERHLTAGLLHPLPTAVEEFKRIAIGLDDSLVAEHSFASRVAHALSTVVRAATPEEFRNSIDSAERIFLEQTASAPPGRLSREALISILLTLLLFFLDQANTLNVAKETRARIEAFERTALSRIETSLGVEDADHDEDFRVVLNPLDVRAEPRNAARHLGIVYPGRRVKVLEHCEEGWVRIDFFVDSSATLSQGWIREDGLQRLDEKVVPLPPDQLGLPGPPVLVDDPDVLSGNWTWGTDQAGQFQFQPRREKH